MPAEKEADHNKGRGIYRRALERFATLKPTEQQNEIRAVWKEIAMGTAMRAKTFMETCSPRDFGQLQKLISSGVSAVDTAFPPQKEQLSPKLIVNLFGSLGARAAAIASPPVPIIDVTPKETTWPSSALTTTETPSLQTPMET